VAAKPDVSGWAVSLCRAAEPRVVGQPVEMDAQTIVLGRYRFRCETELSLEQAAEALCSFGDLLQLRHGYPSNTYEVKVEQPTLGVTASLDVTITGDGGFGFRGQLERTATGSCLRGRIGPALFSTCFYYSLPIWIPLLILAFAIHSGHPVSPSFLRELFDYFFREFFVSASILVLFLWLSAIHGLPFLSRRSIADTIGAALTSEAT